MGGVYVVFFQTQHLIPAALHACCHSCSVIIMP